MTGFTELWTGFTDLWTRFTELWDPWTTRVPYAPEDPNVPSFLIDMDPLRIPEKRANSAPALSR